MYLGRLDDMTAQELGTTTCMECGEVPHVAWKLQAPGYGLLLCAPCAQYLGTQLLKDVRSAEIGQALTVKVRTEVQSWRRGKGRKGRTHDGA